MVTSQVLMTWPPPRAGLYQDALASRLGLALGLVAIWKSWSCSMRGSRTRKKLPGKLPNCGDIEDVVRGGIWLWLSPAKAWMATPSCLRLLEHWERLAASRTF